MSSAVSAAKAITDHVRTWWLGTAEVMQETATVVGSNRWTGRMDVHGCVLGWLIRHCTRPHLLIPRHRQGLHTLSMPAITHARLQDGVISIVQGLTVDDFARGKLTATQDELVCRVVIASSSHIHTSLCSCKSANRHSACSRLSDWLRGCEPRRVMVARPLFLFTMHRDFHLLHSSWLPLSPCSASSAFIFGQRWNTAACDGGQT